MENLLVHNPSKMCTTDSSYAQHYKSRERAACLAQRIARNPVTFCAIEQKERSVYRWQAAVHMHLVIGSLGEAYAANLCNSCLKIFDRFGMRSLGILC